MKSERAEIIELVNQARSSGARQDKACDVVGVSAKTLQRWEQPSNELDGQVETKHEPKTSSLSWNED
jgi:putative transposase